MPEHDEPDAPEQELAADDDLVEVTVFGRKIGVKVKRRKSKVERWGVEDKVVDGESK